MLQLLSPNVRAIMSSARTPQRDRAPDALAAGTPPRLRDDLVALLGADWVLTRPIDLIRFATDASPYRLFPKVIVIARNVDDVRKVLEYARQKHESVTSVSYTHLDVYKRQDLNRPVGQCRDRRVQG